ncbi:hypothetical protein Syun_031798 [Stephania yunnanensis]|uniref:Uncharacterized protein n=1 Tax=Stephania yunnanensis TaxID=152371 RepID=A0AAP0DZT1_9MAGN
MDVRKRRSYELLPLGRPHGLARRTSPSSDAPYFGSNIASFLSSRQTPDAAPQPKIERRGAERMIGNVAGRVTTKPEREPERAWRVESRATE